MLCELVLLVGADKLLIVKLNFLELFFWEVSHQDRSVKLHVKVPLERTSFDVSDQLDCLLDPRFNFRLSFFIVHELRTSLDFLHNFLLDPRVKNASSYRLIFARPL